MTPRGLTLAAMVERERRHLLHVELAAGLLIAAGAAALLIGAGAIALGGARWMRLPRALPFVVWLLVAAAILTQLARTRRRLRARGSAAGVALAIETEQGLRRGALVGVLELEGAGTLAAHAAVRARERLPVAGPLAPVLRGGSSRHALLGAGLAVAGVLLLLTASPLFADGLRAVLRPLDAWHGALLEPLRIVGAPRELVRGAPLSVVVHAPARARVFLQVRETGEPWRIDTLSVRAHVDSVVWTMASLRGDLRLLATDGRASSDSVIVHAVDRPYVGAVTLRAEYPAYLARAPEMLPVGEPLHLPRGTILRIAGRASIPLERVTLAGPEGEKLSLALSAQTFSGRVVATHTTQLQWSAQGTTGAIADVPPPLEIDVITDLAPSVAITSPTADTLLATEGLAPLAISASDDHGIAAIALHIMRGDQPAMQRIASGVGTSWTGTVTLDLASLQLRDGESARVRAEVIDASPWAQRGVSRELVVRRPTMEEQRDAVRVLGDTAISQARALVQAQRSLGQRTDEAARARSRAGDDAQGAMNYASAEKAKGLAQEQRAMADRVQKLQAATRQLEQQLQSAGALDTALARQLASAQAMLRDALTPQLTAQMQKLESAASRMNGGESGEALHDLAQMQQRMREQLEKSAEILKRAAHEGAMQTLADQATELARQEHTLADSARMAGGEDRNAKRSTELADQAKRLGARIADLQARLAGDKAEAGASRTQEAGEHAGKSETALRQSAKALASGGASTPQRSADAAQEMERAAAAMQDARGAQVKEWKQELAGALDRSVQEMMQLAREERSLEQRVRSGSAAEAQRGAQSAVSQGVAQTSERLQGAAKKSALLSPRSQRAVADAQDKVSQATQQMAHARSGAAAQPQAQALGEAADALTKAAAALARDRERANNANSASGFSEMLQELQQAAQRQGQINGQAQSLLSLPGGATGDAGRSLARALARQQRSVADQLEEAGDVAGGDQAAQLGREARQLAERLDGGQLDAGTVARQQQLFRRLLDAGRSLEKDEREDSGKRESRSATGNETFTPGDTVNAKPLTRYRPPTWQEMHGLSAEERRAILDYFARLNAAAQH